MAMERRSSSRPAELTFHLATNLEGRQVADWFTSRGAIAFVLRYRIGPNNPYPIPLQDAQRAVRLVRSLTQIYGISPNRIGMVGFSAGGHLAAATGTLFDDGKAGSSDAVDRFSDRPDFLVLGYPWLNAMQPRVGAMINYCQMIGRPESEDCKKLEQPYTPSLHVSAKTPPTFIYSTTDDAVVPVQTSVTFYSALQSAGVPVEMHLFEHGSHGSGLGAGKAALDQWTVLLEQWLRDHGWLTLDPAVKGPVTSPQK